MLKGRHDPYNPSGETVFFAVGRRPWWRRQGMLRSWCISILAVVPFVTALAAIPLPISDWRYWAVLLTAAWWRTVAPYADRKSK